MSTRIRFSRAAVRLVFAFLLAAEGAHAAPDANDDDASLTQFRERFKQGLDRYEANDIAGALSYWEPLYHDLGPSRGYRIGYNLARAYEVVGDMTRAAERYQSFLDEMKTRHASDKPIEDAVALEEQKATTRLEEIARTRARIRVPPTSPPESVRIDQTEPRLAGFVVYVAPGGHDVVFAPDTAHAHREHVDVQAGQIVEMTPPKIENTIIKPPVTMWSDSIKRPFAPGWLWFAGVATLVVGGGVTGGAYANATILHDHYQSQGPTQPQINDYNNARNIAYASWAVPITLVTLTATLLIWYAVGKHHVRVPSLALAF